MTPEKVVWPFPRSYGEEYMKFRIHYPACWDTAAYPTLMDELFSFVPCGEFECNCDECPNAQV